jgi:hypothetical protein
MKTSDHALAVPGYARHHSADRVDKDPAPADAVQSRPAQRLPRRDHVGRCAPVLPDDHRGLVGSRRDDRHGQPGGTRVPGR